MSKTIVISNKNKHILGLLSHMDRKKAELNSRLAAKAEDLRKIKSLTRIIKI